jgi:hypothetical protein
MNLKELLLYTKSSAELAEMKKQAKLPESANVQETAEAYAETLLDPSIMRLRLRTLHEEDLRFFESLMARGRMKPVPANYASADALRETGYAYVVDAAMDLEVPGDVRAVYEEINDEDFRNEQKKYSWLNDCLKLVPYLYGIVSLKNLKALYEQRRGYEASEETIAGMCDDLIQNNGAAVHHTGDEIIANGIEESGQEEKLRQLHGEIPAGLLSYAEAKDILENRYPSRDGVWKNLRNYFIHYIHVSDDFIDALLEAVWQYMALGNSYQEILQMIHQEAVSLTKLQEVELKAYMGSCWDATRMLMCNGHRPGDVMPGSTRIFFS